MLWMGTFPDHLKPAGDPKTPADRTSVSLWPPVHPSSLLSSKHRSSVTTVTTVSSNIVLHKYTQLHTSSSKVLVTAWLLWRLMGNYTMQRSNVETVNQQKPAASWILHTCQTTSCWIIEEGAFPLWNGSEPHTHSAKSDKYTRWRWNVNIQTIETGCAVN